MDKMILFWITLFLAQSGSNAEGEFCVLHSPASLMFIPRGVTWESTLTEIYAAALGLSVPDDSEWDDLQIMDPFNTPEAVVNVYIDGVSGLGATNYGLKSKIFSLLVEEYEPDTFRGVKRRINQRFDVGGNAIVNFKLSDVTEFNQMKTVFGNVDVESYKMYLVSRIIYLKQGLSEDYMFLKELRTFRAVIEKVKDGVLSSDKLIDFYNFRFGSLHTLSDYYGPFSNQTKEAMKLLGDALQELRKAFVKAYDSSVLVTVVTTEVSHSRRSARAVTTKPLGHSTKWPYQYLRLKERNQDQKSKVAQTGSRQESDVERVGVEGHRNYSLSYTSKQPRTKPTPSIERQDSGKSDSGTTDLKEEKLPEYNSAIFCLFLHVGLAWFFSMLAIVYFLMEMDPGRDTIIYRMTAPRTLKKDV